MTKQAILLAIGALLLAPQAFAQGYVCALSEANYTARTTFEFRAANSNATWALPRTQTMTEGQQLCLDVRSGMELRATVESQIGDGWRQVCQRILPSRDATIRIRGSRSNPRCSFN